MPWNKKTILATFEEKIDSFDPLYFQQVQLSNSKPNDVEILREPSTPPKLELF